MLFWGYRYIHATVPNCPSRNEAIVADVVAVCERFRFVVEAFRFFEELRWVYDVRGAGYFFDRKRGRRLRVDWG